MTGDEVDGTALRAHPRPQDAAADLRHRGALVVTCTGARCSGNSGTCSTSASSSRERKPTRMRRPSGKSEVSICQSPSRSSRRSSSASGSPSSEGTPQAGPEPGWPTSSTRPAGRRGAPRSLGPRVVLGRRPHTMPTQEQARPESPPRRDVVRPPAVHASLRLVQCGFRRHPGLPPSRASTHSDKRPARALIHAIPAGPDAGAKRCDRGHGLTRAVRPAATLPP